MRKHGGEKLELYENVPRDFKFLLEDEEVPINMNFVHI
jgi:hypothetical protein